MRKDKYKKEETLSFYDPRAFKSLLRRRDQEVTTELPSGKRIVLWMKCSVFLIEKVLEKLLFSRCAESHPLLLVPSYPHSIPFGKRSTKSQHTNNLQY